MAIVFVGHGGRNPGDNIDVPPGVTIKFFVDYDLNLDPSNVEAVLSRRDFGSPNQTYVRGTGTTPNKVPNYELGPLSSDELQVDMSAARSLEGVVWTEDDTWLCADPATCGSAGPHTCSGLLGQAATAGDNEVIFLACRGVVGAGSPMSSRLGKPGTDDSVVPELDTWVSDFLARAALDPAAAAQEWDSLPQGTKATLMTYNNIRAWSENREATDPSAPAAVLEAKNYLESHGALALADWVDTWDDTQRSVALADKDVRAGYQQGLRERDQQNRRELGLTDERASGIAPEIVTAREQFASFAGAVDALTGTDADADPVAALGEAYGGLMGQLQVVQGLAEASGDQDLYATAVNTFDTAASVGPALAVYGESMDGESLAALSSSVEALGKWVASFPA
jgi:Putative adhesin Stv domain